MIKLPLPRKIFFRKILRKRARFVKLAKKAEFSSKKVKRELDKMNKDFLDTKGLMEKTHYLRDLSEKKPSETKKQWIERRKKSWTEFKATQISEKIFYKKVKKWMKENAPMLRLKHREIQKELRENQRKTIKKLAELGVFYDPEKKNIFTNYFFPSKELVEKNPKIAFEQWFNSLKRAEKALNEFKSGLMKEIYLKNRRNILMETLYFEADHFPKRKKFLRKKLYPELDSKNKEFEALSQLGDVFVQEVLGNLGYY